LRNIQRKPQAPPHPLLKREGGGGTQQEGSGEEKKRGEGNERGRERESYFVCVDETGATLKGDRESKARPLRQRGDRTGGF